MGTQINKSADDIESKGGNMGWSIGYSNGRDIGYGVPAVCDYPKCDKEIDRGLSYACGGLDGVEGEIGCGLYFCSEHLNHYRKGQQICPRCYRYRAPFNPKPDVKEWIKWKLTDESWSEWRKNNPEEVFKLKESIK